MYARLVEIAAFWSKSLNPAVIVSSKQKQPIAISNKQTNEKTAHHLINETTKTRYTPVATKKMKSLRPTVLSSLSGFLGA
jgi:hypothetical protein